MKNPIRFLPQGIFHGTATCNENENPTKNSMGFYDLR
jgi:hypothetical protein